jgi:hypothetical protein
MNKSEYSLKMHKENPTWITVDFDESINGERKRILTSLMPNAPHVGERIYLDFHHKKISTVIDVCYAFAVVQEENPANFVRCCSAIVCIQ